MNYIDRSINEADELVTKTLNVIQFPITVGPTAIASMSEKVDKIYELNDINLQSKFVLAGMRHELFVCEQMGDRFGAERMKQTMLMQERVIAFLDDLQKKAVGL